MTAPAGDRLDCIRRKVPRSSHAAGGGASVGSRTADAAENSEDLSRSPILLG